MAEKESIKSKPIIFPAPMVRAILSGTKTQTRRLKCPYRVGDLLWVRETFRHYGNKFSAGQKYALIEYADGAHREIPLENPPVRKNWLHWRPSIHLPRWASRLTLEVTGARVERLRDITEEDARAEGAQCEYFHRTPDLSDFASHHALSNGYRLGFAWVWSSIHGPSSWAENPFCWVYTFKRVEER